MKTPQGASEKRTRTPTKVDSTQQTAALRAKTEPWLSDLSDLLDTVGHCRTPVGR